jgi:hypothetical protein
MDVTRRGSWRALAHRRIVSASWLGGLVALNAVTLAGCGAPSFPTGSGTATFTWHSIGSPTTSNAPQTTVHFHGTVGPHQVTGSVRPSQGRGARNRATATFTVAN